MKGQSARARESLSALFFSVCSCERQTNGNIIFSSTVTSLLRLSLENVTRTLSNTQLLLFSFYLCADRFLCFYFVDFQLTLLLLSFVVDVQERRELCVVRDTLVPPPPAPYDADKSMAVERVVLFLFFFWTMYGSSFLFFSSLFLAIGTNRIFKTQKNETQNGRKRKGRWSLHRDRHGLILPFSMS